MACYFTVHFGNLASREFSRPWFTEIYKSKGNTAIAKVKNEPSSNERIFVQSFALISRVETGLLYIGFF